LGKRKRKLQAQLEESSRRREGATGADARTEVEKSIFATQTALQEVEGAMARLSDRDDARFRAYEEHIHQRRYTPPRVQTLFDMELVIQ